MSWLLIILLVLVFVMFALSCIVIVAWIASGTPNVSSTSLDLNPATTNGDSDDDGTTKTLDMQDMTPRTLAGMASKGVKVLVANNTGGYIVATGAPPLEDPKPAERNRLVQTLYIDGKPTVTRTTTFADASLVSHDGPMQVRETDAQNEIIHWYQQNQSHPSNPDTKPSTDHPAPGDPQNKTIDPRIVDVRAMIAAAQPKATTMTVENDDRDQDAADGDMKGAWSSMRREALVAALAAETERVEKEEALDRDPHRFHVTVRSRNACAKSSTLQLPVQLSVPIEYSASPSAIHDRAIRWQIHRVHAQPEKKLQQDLLWQGDAVPMVEIINGALEVDTGLDCRTVAQWLLRLKLVDAKTQGVLASAFFNPTAMISNGPISFGNDMQKAWYHFRLLQNAPNPPIV